jgi:hypothetical protein
MNVFRNRTGVRTAPPSCDSSAMRTRAQNGRIELMSNPKRHHYVPAFYLAGFTRLRKRDDQFAVYDREKKEFRTQTPDSSAHQRFYYATEGTHGERDLSIEKFLGELEGASKPLIDKLENQVAISDDERATLALFFALLHTRVPQFERSVNEMADLTQKTINRLRYPTVEEVRAAMQEISRERAFPPSATAEEAFGMLTGDEFTFAPHRNDTIRMMLRMAVEIGGIFDQFTWHVVHTEPESQFLTIDAPVVLLPPHDWAGERGYGFVTAGTMTLIPLTARCALFMENAGTAVDHRVMPDEGVHINNKGMVSHSERYVFGRDRAYLERVVTESRLPEIPLRPSIVVTGGGA